MAKRGKVRKNQATKDELVRPVRSRKYEEYVLIVCEDQSTEPAYFDDFKKEFENLLPSRTVYVKAVGTGRNSLGVVKQAIAERIRLQEEAGREVSRVWAVFDKDDLDLSEGNRNNFEEAFRLAEAEHIRIAWSNECFELWLLLHLNDVEAGVPIPRKELYARIEEAINRGLATGQEFTYDHGDKSVVEIIKKVGNEPLACERAKRLEKYRLEHKIPVIDANPSTRMFDLVELLRDLLAWYKAE